MLSNVGVFFNLNVLFMASNCQLLKKWYRLSLKVLFNCN